MRALGNALPRVAPVVLALDDMQWADPALWACVQALAESLPPAGGLLVLLYRRPEIERTPGWPLLQAWDRAGRLKALALPPLSVAEVATLLGTQAHAEPAEVHALSGGSPFRVGEWLEQAGAAGRPGHTTARRLQALTPAARAALEAAAIAGETVPYRWWAAVTELPSIALAALSEELTAHHWLAPSPAGYAFTHDLLRAAVYAQIEPARRRGLHARAGHAYAALEPENARARAFHFDQAEMAAEAAQAYRQAGEQDLERFAFREAQSALERALALLPAAPTVERIEASLALARACDVTGDHVRQRPALAAALAGARHLRNDALRLRALLAMGRLANVSDQLVESEAHLTEALALAQATGDHANATEATLLLGMRATQDGAGRPAQAYYQQALEMAQAHGDAGREGRALRGLGISARDRGEPEESATHLLEAAALQGRLGDRLGEALTRTNLVTAYYDLGAWDRLITTAEAVLPQNEALGNRYSAAYVRHLQGLAAHALGDYAAARRLFELAERDYLAIEQRRAAALARNARGLVAEAEGRSEEALALYQAALAEAQAMATRGEAAVAQHDLGALLHALGRPTEAIPLLEAAQAGWSAEGSALPRAKNEAVLGLARLAVGQRAEAAALAESGWTAFQAGLPAGEQPQGWLWALYQLLAALDAREQSQAVLRAAYLELQRQAQAIGDPERRRGFFGKVRLNRDIVAAHEATANAGSQRTVSLARREAPLGRALAPAERVLVKWTVHAPRTLPWPIRPRAAYLELQCQAQAIGDPERRRGFFGKVRLNRDIVAAHEAAANAGSQRTVSLARREAPLGRALTLAERVLVKWTVHAPEDAALANKATRRLQQLRRLLHEAASQGAAPTDDDLARALDVSRRTILRDMQRLAASTNVPPTRKRQK